MDKQQLFAVQVTERAVRDLIRVGVSELEARQLVEAMTVTKEPVILVNTDTEFIIKDR